MKTSRFEFIDRNRCIAISHLPLNKSNPPRMSSCQTLRLVFLLSHFSVVTSMFSLLHRNLLNPRAKRRKRGWPVSTLSLALQRGRSWASIGTFCKYAALDLPFLSGHAASHHSGVQQVSPTTQPCPEHGVVRPCPLEDLGLGLSQLLIR